MILGLVLGHYGNVELSLKSMQSLVATRIKPLEGIYDVPGELSSALHACNFFSSFHVGRIVKFKSFRTFRM